VDEEDFEELVKEHNTELTTEELQDLHKEHQEMTEELSSEEEKNNEGSMTTADIKELLGYWSKKQNLVEK
jgi:Mg/Co/Ni transporter MgtE